jgi:hypothetical protein
MASFFGDVYGAKFPDVVMNSGPLPPTGGLPAPLHDTPDAKINYNSTLLGDLQPYAYGQPAYQSTQNSYLNIPHRIQKFVPVIYLPEPNGESTFRLSHGIDDGDIAFSMRLNKQCLFVTGTNSATRRNGMGTVIDPFINLPTLNYILAGLQVHSTKTDRNKYWWDLLYAMDPIKFPDPKSPDKRDYTTDFLNLNDLVHIIQNCIRPFGITRGSEKQGGQNEMTQSPATWPVPFVTTLVLDGKEDHVVNMWHAFDVHCGEDLVLCLKPMPLKRYTLNHYYKQPTHKNFDIQEHQQYVWQLVPEIHHSNIDRSCYSSLTPTNIPANWITYYSYEMNKCFPVSKYSWQEIGYWHIGRTQVRMNQYTIDGDDYYHNDMVNALRSQYMAMTFQPVFDKFHYKYDSTCDPNETKAKPHASKVKDDIISKKVNRKLVLEEMIKPLDIQTTQPPLAKSNFSSTWKYLSLPTVSEKEPVIDCTLESVAPPQSLLQKPVVPPTPLANPKRRKVVTGSLIHADGTTETQTAQTL